MRRLLPATLIVVWFAVAASGCRPKQEDPRLVQLERENAVLRAELMALKQKAAAPRPGMDEATRRRLEKEGFKVSGSGEGVTLTLPSKVLFASGRATLRASARRALDQAAAVIKKDYAGAQILVQGHTDSQPIRRTRHLWKSNQHLSEARAKSVAAYLRKCGVSPADVSTQGFGASKAVGDNSTVKGRALNRRVEIVIKTAAPEPDH